MTTYRLAFKLSYRDIAYGTVKSPTGCNVTLEKEIYGNTGKIKFIEPGLFLTPNQIKTLLDEYHRPHINDFNTEYLYGIQYKTNTYVAEENDEFVRIAYNDQFIVFPRALYTDFYYTMLFVYRILKYA